MKKLWLLALCLPVGALAGWTPPGEPSPDTILEEARADRQARRYEDAAAKHLWYHHNALQLKPSHGGVRLSFALGDWLDLARSFPPAMRDLVRTRDETTEKALKNPGNSDLAWDAFRMNAVLGETRASRELFEVIDAHDPAIAGQVFEAARGALIHEQATQFALRYFGEPQQWLATRLAFYRRIYPDSQSHSADRRRAEQAARDRGIALDAAALVYTLGREGQPDAAKAVLATVKGEVSTPGAVLIVERALRGKAPPLSRY